MKIDKIEQITDENLKTAKASDLHELFASINKQALEDGIKKISEDYHKQILEKENAIKASNETNEQLKASIKEIESKLAEMKKNHDALVSEAAQREQVEQFSARMTDIENKFDLDDKQKEIVANKVKTLSNEEEFNKYLGEIDILLAAKKKVVKKTNDDDADDKKTNNTKEAKASKEEGAAAIDASLKNGKQDEKNIVPNTSSGTESITERAKKAFGIEGWSVIDKRKNRL